MSSSPSTSGAEPERELQHYGKLYVKPVPRSVSEGDISEHFSRFGKVAAVSIPRHKRTGKRRHFAFVQFVENEDADRAIAAGREAGGHVVKGNRMDVEVVTPVRQEEHQSSDRDLGIKTKIFVGGFPKNIDKAYMWNYFQQFGEVIHTSVITCKFTNRSRGFGFVKFASEETAQKVLEKGWHCLGGMWAEVKAVVPPGNWSGSNFGDRVEEAVTTSSDTHLSVNAPPYYPAGGSSDAVAVTAYFQPGFYVRNNTHDIAAVGGVVFPFP